LKSFIFFQTSYLFEFELHSSFQFDNKDVINITDTSIPVQYLIPKSENRYVDIIAQKEWQLLNPGNGPVECITDGTFSGQYRIKMNSIVLIKMKTNKKRELEEKPVYPSFSPDGYLKYQLYDDNNPKKNYTIGAHRLFGMVFNDKDDIFRKIDCDHIDRFRWDKRPINTPWVTPVANQNNRESCSSKINRKYDKIDIRYLEKWIEVLRKYQSKRIKVVMELNKRKNI
jgi:hypothetical protein